MISYSVMFGFYLLEACSFLMKDENGIYLDERGVGEQVGGLERRESIIIIKIYHKKTYKKNKTKFKKITQLKDRKL